MSPFVLMVSFVGFRSQFCIVMVYGITVSQYLFICSVFFFTVGSKSKSKSKAIPVTGRGGLLGYEMLRIPHCLDNRLIDGGTDFLQSNKHLHIFSNVP
jgi:hypothetical protein